MTLNPRYLAKIDKWYREPIGRWVLDQERTVLRQFWPNSLQHYVVQLSLSANVLVHPAEIHLTNYFCITPTLQPASSIIGDFSLLPIANDSVNIVLAHHWLGMWDEPLPALQEIYRILAPEGDVIICGLRPSGLWHLYDKLHQELQFPWSLRSASIWRVKQWLEEVGFSLQILRLHSQGLSFYRYSHEPPKKSLGYSRLPFGSGYVIVAKKRVVRLTPLKLEWAMRPELANYADSGATRPP